MHRHPESVPVIEVRLELGEEVPPLRHPVVAVRLARRRERLIRGFGQGRGVQRKG